MPPVLMLRVYINTRNIILIIYSIYIYIYIYIYIILYTSTFLLSIKVTPLNHSCLPLKLFIFAFLTACFAFPLAHLNITKLSGLPVATYSIRISYIPMGKQIIAVKIPISQQTSLVDDERRNPVHYYSSCRSQSNNHNLPVLPPLC